MSPLTAQWLHLAMGGLLFGCCPCLSPFFRWNLPAIYLALQKWLRHHSLGPHLSSALASFRIPPSVGFSPLLSAHCWQLRSWGALRGAGKKQRFGSVALILIFRRLDGRLGTFIHRSTQSLPLSLQTGPSDQRGCSHQCKHAICEEASPSFST